MWDSQSEEQEPERASKAVTAAGLLGATVVCGFITGVVLLALVLLPASVPQEKNPHWLDLIVDNRWVVWLIRLSGLAILVMFAVFAVYFVRSINHRMRQRHWLKTGAGLEAEIASDALDDLEPLLENLTTAEGRAEELEEQLAASNEAIQQLYNLLNHVEAEELVAAVERAAAAGGAEVPEASAGAEQDPPDGT